MGISATKRKDCDRWQVTVRRYGLRRTRLAPAGVGKREATATIGPELLAEIEASMTPQPNPVRPPKLWDFCVGVYADRHGLSERTWRQRQYKVAGIMEDLGHLHLDEVTTPVVTEWLDLLQADGAPLKKGGRGQALEAGGATFNDFLVVLKAIFRVAVENHYLDAVPFRNKLAPIDLATDREAWTPAMKDRLLRVAADRDPGMYRLAEFLMVTGCRPVEALRLRWEQVQEVPAPTLTITGKAFRYRKIPIDGALAEFFKRLPRLGTAVFPVESGPTAAQPYKFWPQRRWERICEAADVPSVVYDLRHTFITEMVVKGVALPMIAKWAGNSVRVIEERYSHLSPEFLKEVAEKVEHPVGGGEGKGTEAASAKASEPR